MAKQHLNIEPIVDKVKSTLDDNGYFVTIEQKIDYGYQIRLSQGSIINIYTTGSIAIQGKKDTGLNLLLGIR